MVKKKKGSETAGGNTEEGSSSVEEEDVAKSVSGNIASEERSLQLAEEEVWTMAEFEEAEPCDVIEVSEEQIRESIQAEEEDAPEVTGKGEGLEAGGLPEEEADEEADAETQATSGGYNYPPPFTRHNVLCPYTLYPYRTVGKLFFKRGSKSYVCSAASMGNNAIWTAGHCLHDGNNSPSGWSTNVVFVPAYKNGSAPYGQWPAKQLWVRTAWYKDGNPKGLCQDMGGAVLYPQKGKKISQKVGWLGFAYNWSRYQHWHAMGYPAAKPFNGQLMVDTQASYAYNGSVGCSPPPVGIGCDMTGGCSGGPWVWRFGTNNYLNGNNSYRRSNKPEEIFSPYFGNDAKQLWDLLKKAS